MSSTAGLDQFLTAQKAARGERALEKRKEHAATVIQSTCRGFIARKKYKRKVIADFDELLGTSIAPIDEVELQPNVHVFFVASRFLAIAQSAKSPEFRARFERLCKYLIRSVETSDSAKISYIAVS